MSFAAPAVLAGLVVLVPAGLLLVWGIRRRADRMTTLASPALLASIAPRRPGPWRRGLPGALLLGATACLIVAAARPRVAMSAPVRAGTVMLVNDVSDSMTSTDVRPSRLGAAQRAAARFLTDLPATVAVGSIAFARRPAVLAAPTHERAVVRAAVGSLRPGGGGTAIGEAIASALALIAAVPRVDHRRPPGAIVLLSDGSSNVGVDPLAVAGVARRDRVRIDTVAIGTPTGTMQALEAGRRRTIPAPVSPAQLAQVAAATGGRFFRAPDAVQARSVYAHLAATLGRRRVLEGVLWVPAAGALLCAVAAAGASLRSFGRLI